MITINKHTIYSDYFNTFKEVYSSFYNSSNLSLPSYPFQTKLNTPLIVTSLIPSLISDSLTLQFRESMFYLGQLHSIVPAATKVHAQNDYKHKTGKYLIPHSYFISNEIVYADNEFGYIATNQDKPKNSVKNFTKNQKFSYQKLFEICFSASSFRYMLIKAECMTFLFYFLKSRNIDIPSFYGAFNYALTKASQFFDSPITYGIVYVWELVTAFNHFTSLLSVDNFDDDSHLNLPLHHVYKFPRYLSSLSSFGDYDLSTCKHNLNLPKIGFLNHCSITPRISTSIPSNSNTIFYLPYELDASGILSSSFNKFIDWLMESMDCFDIYDFFNNISLINEFENNFVVSANLPTVVNGEYFVNSIDEANKIIKQKIFHQLKVMSYICQ